MTPIVPAAVARMAVLVSLALLCGCRTPKLLCFNPSGLKKISIVSTADSNGGRPIAVDLVYITNKPILQAVARLKARDYFANKNQLLRDFPTGMTIRSWELQAGQFVPPSVTSPPCNLVGTLVFVNFAAEGDHRISLGKARAGNVQLGPDGFAWSPQ